MNIIDPYKMIIVSLFSSLLLLIFILFYKFIYPKKNINLLILLILISILPVISIFRTGSYESGDFNIHIYRTMDFYKSLSEGNFMPSWAPNLNANYGYPLFIFNYTLPYYFISLIHFLGFSFINSLKIFLGFNLIFGSIFGYYFGKIKFNNNLAGFIFGIFFTFFPYRLISIHFKVTIGEILAYTLLPLYFIFLEKTTKKSNLIYLLTLALILSLIALSHIYMAIFLIPISFFYILNNVKSILKSIKISVIPFLLAIIISSYQWIAPLIFRSYLYTTHRDFDINNIYFPSFKDLLFSPWRMGFLFQGPYGEISHLVGYMHIIIILISIYILINKKYNDIAKNHIKYLILIIFSLIFFITPYSKFIWNNLPLINAAGPHRLLLFIGFFISLLACIILYKLKSKKILLIILFVTILSSILNWGHRNLIENINDSVLANKLPLSTYEGESHFYAASIYQDPKNLWFNTIPKSKLEFASSQGIINNQSINSTKHNYNILVTKPGTIKENTLYFPGWDLKINNSKKQINPDKNGVISFQLKNGSYKVSLTYTDIFIYKIFKIISLLSFTITFLSIILLTFNKYQIFATKSRKKS